MIKAQLCNKLNSMEIKLHNGKRLVYGVMPMPENVQKNLLDNRVFWRSLK